MKITFLGSGTSHGVPVIACNCKVCKSHSKKNKRYRSSVFIETNDGKSILIDVTPEFRLQAVRAGIKKIDTILLTHSHADHLHGIDDIRIFSCDCFERTATNAKTFDAPPLPVYTNATAVKDLQARFGYFFVHPKEGGGHAKVTLSEVKESFKIGQTEITPIPMLHGHLETTGWLLTETKTDGSKTSVAYLTDCSFISDESIELIHQKTEHISHLIIDGLRIRPHSTHFNFLQAIEASKKIGADKVWITHLTHSHSHAEVTRYLKKHADGLKIKPAYDGLKLSD